MKVKFLVPEIDKVRWAEKFKEQIQTNKLTSRDLQNIGSETYTEQNIYKYKKGSIPTIDRFLTFCRYLLTSPDEFFSPIPKWIECELNCKVEDFPRYRILGKLEETFYIIPTYLIPTKPCNYIKNIFLEFPTEPNPNDFSDFHFHKTEYDINEHISEGKLIYRIPYVKDEETSKKIFSLLDGYKFSDKQLATLLCLNNSQSITNRRNNKNKWTVSDIYKLSWILNKPFEDLIEIGFRNETRESYFDFLVYIKEFGLEALFNYNFPNEIKNDSSQPE